MVVRRLRGPSARLTRALRDAAAPDLLPLEVGQAILKYARAGRLAPADAAKTYADALAIPIELHPSQSLAPLAFDLALRLRLSMYDATYAALAAQLDLPLVTADRRLADAVERSVLVP